MAQHYQGRFISIHNFNEKYFGRVHRRHKVVNITLYPAGKHLRNVYIAKRGSTEIFFSAVLFQQMDKSIDLCLLTTVFFSLSLFDRM
jgi:hypothetical protein